MRMGVLTSSGDCPGLNAVIRSVVHHAVADHGDEVIGFRDGWKGLPERDCLKLDLDAVSGILDSSRVQPSHLRPGGTTRPNACCDMSSRPRRPAPALGLGKAVARPGPHPRIVEGPDHPSPSRETALTTDRFPDLARAGTAVSGTRYVGGPDRQQLVVDAEVHALDGSSSPHAASPP